MSEGKPTGAGEQGVDLARLRERVEHDPGCADFPAVAETERRAGRAEEAQRVAEAGLRAAPGRLAGRVALGLALLDQGELEAARRELAAVLDPRPRIREDAGASRSPRKPGPSAEATPAGAAGGGGRSAPARKVASDLPVGSGSAFRTRTMASLLERQGDRGRAEEILEGLEAHQEPGEGPPASDVPSPGISDEPAGAASKREIETTLERWLENVQRGRP